MLPKYIPNQWDTQQSPKCNRGRWIATVNCQQRGGFNWFFWCYPTIIGKAAPVSSVVAGLINNGMIDDTSFLWADYNKILGACKNLSNIAQYDKLYNNNSL